MIDRRFRAEVTINDRHNKKGGDGGKEQAADDGAAERRVLFAAFAEAERHGQHAEDHGGAVISTGRMRE